jgi:hypothetical protein
MMMSKMERSTFNKTYNYRLVVTSDNIDLKHCGNCTHYGGIKGLFEVDGCFLMIQCEIPRKEIEINQRRGLCDLWQKKKENTNGNG